MSGSENRIELYYWPGIQGRGEFVRLLLEESGASYVDVVRRRKSGIAAMMRFLDGEQGGALPFAPPFVKVGEQIVSQTANALAFLAPRVGRAPKDAAGREEAAQIQLTLCDFVDEIHDTHHPIAGSLNYDDQKAAAKRRAKNFVIERLPKYLDWLETVLARNARSSGQWLVGRALTYPDLSAFQIVEGLQYAFPNATARLSTEMPRLLALRDRVAARPNLRRYLDSKRRLPFNQMGVFRQYPELDTRPPRRRNR